MICFNKLSIAAVSSVAAFLALASFDTNSAQAALFKFSFEGEGVNGYFIYDDSYPAFSENTGIAAYIGAATEYKFDLGEAGVFEGTMATPTVTLSRQENGTAGEVGNDDVDTLILQEHADEREPQTGFDFISYFVYPKGTFDESTDQPTTVPSTALAAIYANVNYPNTLGKAAFTGTVKTRIEKIPESGLLPALLGVGAYFIFRRPQRQQLLSPQD